MERRVSRSRGIDLSEEMLKIARTKVRRSELICADITATPLTDTYDLITAFRFFLNAAPALRSKIMKTLAGQLRDQNSRLIFNNHGNPWSYKAVAWPLHRLRQTIQGRPSVGNYLTDSEVRELVAAAGLEILEQVGYGLISPKLFRFAPSRARELERDWSSSGMAQRIGVNQLYVAKLSASA
jgi:predicted TPR repeat methyltransferase